MFELLVGFGRKEDGKERWMWKENGKEKRKGEWN